MKKRLYKEEFEYENIVTWSDLNEDQKDYVVDHVFEFGSLNWIWEFYNENLMEWYDIDKSEIVKKYEKQGLSINSDKMYWQDSSQGPYPEWNLGTIFDTTSVGNSNDTFADITFSGRSTDVEYEIDLYYFDEEEQEFIYEYSIIDIDELSDPKYHLTTEFIEEIKSKIDLAQQFIDEIWDLIYNVCTSYPDDDYIRGELDAYSDDDYMIIDEYSAKPVKA